MFDNVRRGITVNCGMTIAKLLRFETNVNIKRVPVRKIGTI